MLCFPVEGLSKARVLDWLYVHRSAGGISKCYVGIPEKSVADQFRREFGREPVRLHLSREGEVRLRDALAQSRPCVLIHADVRLAWCSLLRHGAKADLVFSDVPWNENKDFFFNRQLAYSDRRPWPEYERLMREMYAASRSILFPTGNAIFHVSSRYVHDHKMLGLTQLLGRAKFAEEIVRQRI